MTFISINFVNIVNIIDIGLIFIHIAHHRCACVSAFFSIKNVHVSGGERQSKSVRENTKNE